MEKNIYRDFVEVEFEGQKLRAPIEYDKHLRNIFGDYMKFPPVEEQVAQHNFKAYCRGK